MSQAREKRIIGKHACEGCRKSKTRCFTDTLEEYGKCRKCHATAQDCEWKTIAVTRRRKRTDARVADLERQIARLTTALHGSESSGISPDGQGGGPGHLLHTAEGSTVGHLAHRTDSSKQNGPMRQHATEDSAKETYGQTPIEPDVRTEVRQVDHHQLSFVDTVSRDLRPDLRAKLLRIFVETLLPQCPVCWFPIQQELLDLERNRPNLAAILITAACSIAEPQLYCRFYPKSLAHLSNKVIVKGEKSLDLLQAVLITSIWMHPPDDPANLSIYQWTHIACTMALELGLGGRTTWHASRQAIDQFASDPSQHQTEQYRTMLSVYLLCSRVAISFRRRNIISYSPSTATIIDIFGKCSTDTNDQRLLAWLQLQTIAEDIEKMKFDSEVRHQQDARAISNAKDDFTSFRERLHQWEATIDPVLLNEALQIDVNFCKAKLHEAAIYFDQETQELDLSSLAVTSKASPAPVPSALNPAYIRALLSFVQDCQLILNVILAADISILRSLPVLTAFRVPYAFKALAMLHKRLNNPDDNVSKIIDDDTIRWDYYAQAVSHRMQDASCDGLYAIPTMVLKIRDTAGDFAQVSASGRPNTDSRLPRSPQNLFEPPTVAHYEVPVSDTAPTGNDDAVNVHQPEIYSGTFDDLFWQNEFMNTRPDDSNSTYVPGFW